MTARILLIALLAPLALGLSGATVNAVEGTSNLYGAEDLVISIIPENPGPDEGVTLDVKNFLTDISRAYIAWYVDGIRTVGGIGKTRFEFTTGSVGSRKTVRAVVETEEGRVLSRTLVFEPGDLDLLWEANTYTPPFYRGKALPSSESAVTVVAIPRFRNSLAGRPENTFYEWKQDGKKLLLESGLGKNTITITSARLMGTTEISAVARTLDTGAVAEDSIKLVSVFPRVKLYEEAAISGTKYREALQGAFTLDGGEVALKVEPFYFSVNDVKNESIEYLWRINAKEASFGKENQRVVVLRVPDQGRGGASRITVEAKNTNNPLQFVKDSLTVTFIATPYAF